MQPTEPVITIDPLEPQGGQWLHAEAVQGDVQAWIDIRPYPSLRGYVLDRHWDRTNRDAPGRMGRKQEQRAKELQQLLVERVEAALTAANWRIVRSTPTGEPIWSYTRPVVEPSLAEALPTPPVRRQVVTQAHKQGLAPYQRTIQTREITFACARCGKTVTESRYPSPGPRYCSDACEQEAVREQTRARVQRFRARQKGAGTR